MNKLNEENNKLKLIEKKNNEKEILNSEFNELNENKNKETFNIEYNNLNLENIQLKENQEKLNLEISKLKQNEKILNDEISILKNKITENENNKLIKESLLNKEELNQNKDELLNQFYLFLIYKKN